MGKTTFLFLFLTLTSGVYAFGGGIQWASELRYQYNQYADVDFSGNRALGPPDAYPPGTLHTHAFRLQQQDCYGTLVVGFEQPQRVGQLVVLESNHPGCIVQVKFIDENGLYYSVYKGRTHKVADDFRTLVIGLPLTTYRVCAVELHLNSIPAPGNCQIDAVGILGSEDLSEVRKHLMGANFNIQPVLSFTAEKEKLGPGINTRFTEAKPLVSYDGQTLYFARMFYPGNCQGKYDQQDIYFSRLVLDRWSDAQNIGSPLNDVHANGVCSVAPDGRSLVVLNGYAQDGRVVPGISITHRTERGWSAPEKLEIVDFVNRSRFQDFYLSADQEVLLMAVERPGGMGEQDVYASVRSGYRGYSKPVNLGAGVNTPKADFAPFLAPDNATLYFASEGHSGYGESDIYRTRRLDDSWKRWSEPENLGPMINTASWEGYFSITVAGDYAYFVSSEGDRRDAQNIYRISLLQNDAPVPQQTLMAIQGRVLDADTGIPIEAEVVAGGTRIGRYATRSGALTGNFLLYLPDKTEHIAASAEGYAAEIQPLDGPGLTAGLDGMITLYLQPLGKEQHLTVDPLLFVQSKAELLEEGLAPLEKLVSTLQVNPALRVQLIGHTDGLGSSDAKRALSIQRAERVKEFLVRFGIDRSRIHTDGLGGARPVAPNDREENRARNRRVEVRFMDDGKL